MCVCLPKVHLFGLHFLVADKLMKLDPKLLRTLAKIKGQTSATKCL